MVDGDWQVTASANQRGAGAEIVETSAKAKDVTALQFASEIAYNKDGINANGRNECQWMGSIKESKPYMRKRYNLLVHISQIKKLVRETTFYCFEHTTIIRNFEAILR